MFSNGTNAGSNGKERQRCFNRSLTLLWGATGEQEWTPALVNSCSFCY